MESTADIQNIRVELVASKQLKLCAKPLPPVPPHGLILKTKYAGICHTDLHLWEDKFIVEDGVTMTCDQAIENFQYPIVLGHEIAGEVYALGNEECEGAPALTLGDHVVVYPWNTGCYPPCNACSLGQEPMCQRKPLPASFGMHTDGGWETFVVVERRSSVVVVPSGVGLDVASLVPCSGITAFSSLTKAMPTIESSFQLKGSCSVLICGLGGVGMWAVGFAKSVLPPATKIYAVDVVESKLQWASSRGIAGVIQAVPGMDDNDAISQILEVTQGGVDVAIDFVGTSSTAKRLAASLNKNSILVLVGLAGGSLKMSLVDVILRDIVVRGSDAGDKKMVNQVLELIAQNKVQPPPIDCCSLSVDDVSRALNRLIARQVQGRCVIKFS